MKECKLYQCEICNTQYKLKVDCLACEKNHAKPEGIKEYKYHAEKTYKNYPDTIVVLMKDGKEIKYKR